MSVSTASGNGPGRVIVSPDVADTIAYVVTRPRHVAMNEVLMRPSEQER